MEKVKPDIRRHVFAVIVDNESGVLARVVGLISGRGYNIESLTVSPISIDNRISRITLVTSGSMMVIDQIKAQLGRLIPVYAVYDLTLAKGHIEKEVLMLKIISKDEKRRESLRIADIFRAKVLDTTLYSFIFMLTGSKDKIDSFIQLMDSLGKIEIARSGIIALARGDEIIKI